MQKRSHISKLKLTNDDIITKLNKVWEFKRKALECNVWQMKNQEILPVFIPRKTKPGTCLRVLPVCFNEI